MIGIIVSELKKTSGFKFFLKSISILFIFSGCATLFGWKIHAPGILSQGFYDQVKPESVRLGLHLPESLMRYVSNNRGGRFADPQTYFVGEAMTPMVIEGFQQGFGEFVYLEDEPTDLILKRYSIPYLVIIQVRDFLNKVTMKGQALELITDVQIFNPEGKLLQRFEARGASDAQKIFAKKGGPEVNLNAAIENNIRVTIQYVQDFIQQSASVAE